MKFLFFILILFFSNVVYAQATWSGLGGDNDWKTKSNWVDNKNPGKTDAIIFDGSLRPINNNDLNNLSPPSLTFNSGATAFTLNGNAISLSGNLINNSVNSQILNFAEIDLTGNRTINTASGNISILSPITGSFGIEKIGNSILSLSGNNTYTGSTIANAGSLFQNGTHIGGNYLINSILGGNGTIGSISSPANVTFAGSSKFYVLDLIDPLTIYGNATFNVGFGIDNILGLDWDSLDLNTPYTIISTSQVFSPASIENFGYSNRAPVGTGRFAYFQNGSLQIVVVPEPNLFFGSLMVLTTFWLCRKHLFKS